MVPLLPRSLPPQLEPLLPLPRVPNSSAQRAATSGSRQDSVCSVAGGVKRKTVSRLQTRDGHAPVQSGGTPASRATLTSPPPRAQSSSPAFLGMASTAAVKNRHTMAVRTLVHTCLCCGAGVRLKTTRLRRPKRGGIASVELLWSSPTSNC
jgi:hypothetical protein